MPRTLRQKIAEVEGVARRKLPENGEPGTVVLTWNVPAAPAPNASDSPAWDWVLETAA